MTSRMSARAGRGALLVVLAAIAVCTPLGSVANQPSEDSAALATKYEQQATEFRAEADRHAKMARRHQAGAGSSKVAHASIVQHCERIAANLNAAARESEALAETYRKLAREEAK